MLGPVATRLTAGDPDWVSAGQVGAVAVAASAAAAVDGREIRLGSQAELSEALARFQAAPGRGPAS